MSVNQVTPTRRRRGAYAKSEQTRTSILDAALEVFAESGYRSGSLRNVAERVGMSEAGLLHHFPSKSALLAAVLGRRDEQTAEQFPFDTDGGRDSLRLLVQLAEYNASTPGVVELFCTLAAEATSPEHPAHGYFVDRYRMTTDAVATVLETVESNGGLRDGVHPRSAARGILALMDGLQIQWLLDRESVDMAADLKAYLDRILTERL